MSENERPEARLLGRDRYRDALIEIDTYLANDPDVWRINSVAKVGDVLCDVLGEDTIRRINSGVAANLCTKCLAELPKETHD